MRTSVRYAGTLIVLGVLTGSLLLSLALLVGSERKRLVLATAFVPWAVPGYAVALLVLLLAWRVASGIRRPLVGVGVALSIGGILLHAARVAPAFVGVHAAGDPDLTVVALNMEYGGADIDTTARLVEREGPEVIVLTEATPEAMQALADRAIGGTGSRWPHQGGEAHPGAFGTVVLSSYPIGSSKTLEIRTGVHRMRVQAPTPFWLSAVHTTQPANDTRQWRSDFDVLIDDVAEVRGPHLAVGDFNATLDHAPMRELMASGLRSAAEEANSGWQPTWPTARSRTMGGVPVPFRLMAIDHVLLSRELSAVSTDVASVPGTDHHAVIARVVFR